MRPSHLAGLVILGGSILSASAVRAEESANTEVTEAMAPAPSPVTPPEILEKVDPDYPDQAVRARKAGTVVLRLDIDDTGKVTQATVAEGAGFGMDEAARQAALRMTFKPALRGDQPIRSRILYRMTFTLKETLGPAAPSASPTGASPVGTLRGVVRLGQTDLPGAGARVRVRLAKGRVLEATTDTAGAWQIADLPPGRATVEIAWEGYDPLSAAEDVAPGELVEVTYRLRPAGGTLEVEVRGERRDREVTRRTVERQELSVVPGTSGDALKVIEAMPGVARPPPFSGLIVVRGSSPFGTQTFIDGTFVPLIYHFGGLSSIVPTEMIESIDFYPGNFGAKYGRVTGGILDVKLRAIEHDHKYHGLAQVDLMDARLMLRGPVPWLRGWSFNLGARRSHIDAWIGSVVGDAAGFSTAPVYYDWQAFAETKPTAKSVFRIGVFGSDDQLELVLKNALAEDPGVGNSAKGELRTLRFQALYRHQVSEALSIDATASVGLDKEYSRFGGVSSVDIDYVPIIVRGDVSYRLSDQFLLRAGPDVILYRYRADVLSAPPPEPGAIQGNYSNRPPLRFQDTGYFSAPAAFTELEWTPDQRAKFLFGGRLDYFSESDRWDPSPRLNARYDVNPGRHRTTIKGGVGLFHEPPQIIQSIEPFGTAGLRSNRALHSSLGIEQEVSERVEVSVEAFHKYLDHLVVAALNEDGSSGYSNLGSGQVYGTETLVRWKPGGRFFGWLAYTLSRSTRQAGPDQPERLFEFDQTHVFTALGSYDFGRGWRAGAKFRLVSGNPYTPCAGGYLNGASGTYECIQGPPFSRRIPTFHQLDLRVDKTWTFKAAKLTAYLDLQNAYNRANPEGVRYNYRYTNPQWQTGLPVIPSLGIRGEF
jgi:TonB family protein